MRLVVRVRQITGQVYAERRLGCWFRNPNREDRVDGYPQSEFLAFIVATVPQLDKGVRRLTRFFNAALVETMLSVLSPSG